MRQCGSRVWPSWIGLLPCLLLAGPGWADSRFSAVLKDGTRLEADEIRDWHDTAAAPKLGERTLFDPANPVRWVRDNSLRFGEAPTSYVELVGGDRLPGKVVGYRSGESDFAHDLACVVVEPSISTNWPDPRQRRNIRVLTRWLRRIVWEARGSERYQPNTVFFRDGRQVNYRSLRWAGDGLRLLLPEGTSEVSFAEIAELHLPAFDSWQAYFEQLAILSPEGDFPLIRLETIDGSIVMTSIARFQARNHGSHPDHWYHAFQPAWSLDPLWLKHRTIRTRCFFLPHEVPLGLISPSRVEQRAALSSGWNWRIDRNVQGATLASGGQEFGWGLGVHAFCALEFPLPEFARGFRARVGLDALVASGGCAKARVWIGRSEESSQDSKPQDLEKSPNLKRLYESPLMIGAGTVYDFGELPIAAGDNRLLLVADPAFHERQPGADPLDIRDLVDWLEPRVELDRTMLRTEVLRQVAGLVPAWQGWTIQHAESSPAALVNYWDESDGRMRFYQFQSAILPRERLLTLSRTVEVTPQQQHLLLSVSRFANLTTPAKLLVQVNGESLGQFEVPERRLPQEPDPLMIPLGRFSGQQVRVEITQLPLGPKALVDWRRLDLVERWPGLKLVYEDERAVAELLSPEGDSVQPTADKYRGSAGLKVFSVQGSDPHRLPLELAIRESPALGEFRFIRFAWKKQGAGRICLSFEHDHQWGPTPEQPRRSYRFDAGHGDASYGAAIRLSNDVPSEWTVVTRDLTADFGEFNLTGLSLSAPDGQPAQFDHIYLGRSLKDFEWIGK